MSNVMSADEAAVRAAEAMFSKGEGGGMPLSQMGSEGGLSEKAPGKPMVTKAKKAAKPEEDEDEDEKKTAPPWVKKARDPKDEAEKEEKEEGEEKEKEEKEEGEEEEKAMFAHGEKSEKDEDEGEDMKKKKACKSEIEENDLLKALDVLDATAAGLSDAPDRRAELADKLAMGTIEKSEQAELVQLLGGNVPSEEEEAEIRKSFSEVFADDTQMKQDYEISPFIERHSQLVAESLDLMRSSLEKSESRQGQFNVALAKSFRSIGQTILDQADLIKSQQGQLQALTERLGIVEKTPVGRKSVSGTAALAKSFGDGDESKTPAREQILDGLERLMSKSRSNNFMAPCGEPIERAVALYESTGKISKSLLADVRAELGTK